MDLGRLRARLASPLTEVKSLESGEVDPLNSEAGGKMVKMLCAPYRDPPDPLEFLEALDTDMTILNANLADGANSVSPVVTAKVIENPKTVLVIYGGVSPAFDALEQFWSHLGLQRKITGMRKSKCVTGCRLRARRRKAELKCKHWFWWGV